MKWNSWILFAFLNSALLWGQTTAGPGTAHADPLREFNASIQNLTRKVAPSVVQIEITRFGSVETPESGNTNLVVSKQRALGSGVLVDVNGYILTNAHVVEGAQSIRVLVMPQPADTVRSVLSPTRTMVRDATLVGIYKIGDLALLKIAPGNLPPPLAFAEHSDVRQGDLVFAFGSPAGLQNSVSMGVVSSIARQPDPDSPMFYIQTDAPINRGNSGGPLVNVDGQVVGINTFIYSESGGSEGIGFAIPSTMAQFVYQEIKEHGHVHRLVIGTEVQAVTEPLARALDLSRNWGVMVTDVLPGTPAEAAGLKVNDILLSMDGREIDTVVAFQAIVFRHGKDPHIQLTILRGDKEIELAMVATEEQHAIDRLSDLVSTDENNVSRLGVIGFNVDDKTRPMLGALRVDSGVIVAAKTLSRGLEDNRLQTGDIIHTVNGQLVENLKSLRAALDEVKANDPVAVLVERAGSLQYVTFGGE